MPRVLFSEQALAGLEIYIKRYEDYFVALFTDSGIWSEEIIIEKYRLASKELLHRIIAGIVKRLEMETVLGRKRNGSQFSAHFLVNEKLITIYYLDSANKRERVVVLISVG